MGAYTFLLSKKDTKKVNLDGKEVTIAVARYYCRSYDVYAAYEGEGYHKRKILARMAIAERAAENFNAEYICFLYSSNRKLSTEKELELYPYRSGDFTWGDTPEYTGMQGKEIKKVVRISKKDFVTKV